LNPGPSAPESSKLTTGYQAMQPKIAIKLLTFAVGGEMLHDNVGHVFTVRIAVAEDAVDCVEV